MNTDGHYVLTGFSPVHMSEPVSQRFTLEISAYGMALHQCRANGIAERSGLRDALARMREKFSRYAISADQIRRRQLVMFPRLSNVRYSEGVLTLKQPEEVHLRMYDHEQDLKGTDLRVRHASYDKVVSDCLARMYGDEPAAPEELIHVTCSGYLSPSPVERMVATKQWFDTTVTHSYHMGCYGAFPAIKMAHGFLSSASSGATRPVNRVDIVHTELLSLHSNLEDDSIENIITSTLFADGFIRYCACRQNEAARLGLPGLKILGFKEHLLPDCADDMTWVPATHQFRMTLSVMVPVVIKRHVKRFVQVLLAQSDIDFSRAKQELVFAIHPGGPKIVDHIQEELGLRDDQVEISQSVFYENGNMSSATIPHILMAILAARSIRRGTRIVALGFGPGLTVTGLVLEKT